MELLKASKGQVKYLQSLKLKKNRLKYASFVVEGAKVVEDLIRDNNLKVKALYGIDSFHAQQRDHNFSKGIEFYSISTKELDQVSSLRKPHQVVAECSMPLPVLQKNSATVLFLDRVADPGNLGTIIRSCDWFDIDQIVLSPECADLFNPKTVQAAKGSLGRIAYSIMTASELAANLEDHTWYLADVTGRSIHDLEVSKPFILAMGSESHGLSDDALSHGGTKVSLPKLSQSAIDSLNVAMATTALLACICR